MQAKQSAQIIKELARVTYTKNSLEDIVLIVNVSTLALQTSSRLAKAVAYLLGIVARYGQQQITQGLSPIACTGRNFPIQSVSSLTGDADQIIKETFAMLAKSSNGHCPLLVTIKTQSAIIVKLFLSVALIDYALKLYRQPRVF